MRGIKYTATEKRRALKLWLEDKNNIMWVAHKMRCTERTLWRWRAAFDGTLGSLNNKSSRPHTRHPNAHTEREEREIKQIFEQNPDMSYCEAYAELRLKHAYSRTYFGFWRFVVKNNIRAHPPEEKEAYIPQPYDTPQMFGHKWQMDVKYVPLQCDLTTKNKIRYYQYTMIDEATRERFLFAYPALGSQITVDFVKRAIVYFGYVPLKIQTDNGGEFTNSYANARERETGKKFPTVHPLDVFLKKLGIEHQLIRAYTPRHNGKVERSHRTDNEFFYRHLQFSSLDELRSKMKDWNHRYNNKAHSSLRNRFGKKVWQTPLEKRAELIEQCNSHELSLAPPRRFDRYPQELAYSY